MLKSFRCNTIFNFRSTANVLVAKGSVQPFRLKLKKRIFKGITFLSCFDFQDDGILTQKSANIGAGQFVKIDKKKQRNLSNKCL